MKKQWLRYGVLEVLLLAALYVLPRFWRRYIPEMLEQGVFQFQVLLSPVLIALAIVGVLYGMGLVKAQKQPLSLLPAVAVGWALVFLTDTPVWGAFESWKGSCVVPGAMILLLMLTIELIVGCFVRKNKGFDVRAMLLALTMLLCACAPILEYHIGQWILSDAISHKMGANAWVLQLKTVITYLFYLAGGLPLIPYIKRVGSRPLGIALLLTGLSGPVVQLVSIATMHTSHYLYTAVAENVALTAFAVVAVAGVMAMMGQKRKA